MGRLAEERIAPPEVRGLRELTGYRIELVRLRPGKEQVHAVPVSCRSEAAFPAYGRGSRSPSRHACPCTPNRSEQATGTPGLASTARADRHQQTPGAAHECDAEKQERAARIARHFERARHWGAVEDAERLHRAEKEIR